MFEKFINLLKLKEKVPFDASVFNDPLALDTQWTPLSRGGANFKTHKMIVVNMNRIEFRPGLFMIFFAGIFASFGLMFASVSSFIILSQNDTPAMFAAVFTIAFGAVFVAIGYAVYRFASVPRIFDKSMGFYWKGREEPNQMINPEYQKYTKLNEIRAIQLISEHVRGNKSSYTSYELNIVLKDKSRINVIDHGNIGAIRTDSAVLGEFLNVPVWDAIGERQ